MAKNISDLLVENFEQTFEPEVRKACEQYPQLAEETLRAIEILIKRMRRRPWFRELLAAEKKRGR